MGSTWYGYSQPRMTSVYGSSSRFKATSYGYKGQPSISMPTFFAVTLGAYSFSRIVPGMMRRFSDSDDASGFRPESRAAARCLNGLEEMCNSTAETGLMEDDPNCDNLEEACFFGLYDDEEIFRDDLMSAGFRPSAFGAPPVRRFTIQIYRVDGPSFRAARICRPDEPDRGEDDDANGTSTSRWVPPLRQDLFVGLARMELMQETADTSAALVRLPWLFVLRLLYLCLARPC